mgnify:CR=1 FL=1
MQTTIVKKVGKVTELELSTSSAKNRRILERELAIQLPPEMTEGSGILIKTKPGTATITGYCSYLDEGDRLLIKSSNSDWVDVPLMKRESFGATLETDGEIKLVLCDTETNTGTTKISIESVKVEEKEGNYPTIMQLAPIDILGSVREENGNLILSTGGGDSDDSKFKKWFPLPIPSLMTEGSGALFSVVPGYYELSCFILTTESNVERDSLFVCTDEYEVIEVCDRRQATIQETKTRYSSRSIKKEFSTNGKFSIIGADTRSKSGSTYFHITELKRLKSKPLIWDFDKEPEDKELAVYLDRLLELKANFSTPGLLTLHIESDGTYSDPSEVLINETSFGREVVILSTVQTVELVFKSKVGIVKISSSFREMSDLKERLENLELESILEENDYPPESSNYIVLI